MTTLFIADLHLSDDEPAITAGFLGFLQTQAVHADALYILGDLFEVWVGDDVQSALHDQIANALFDLTNKGTPCYFIHGNRDFLLGKQFARRCNMTLLDAETVVSVYAKHILLLHGDTLCTDDVEYQKFRKKVNNPFIRYCFLCLPLKWRLGIATKLRSKSKLANKQKSSAIMDVNATTVMEKFHAYQVNYMIHGHTHKPAIHQTELANQTYYRIVVGAWHTEGSVVCITPDFDVKLLTLPFHQ